VPSSTSVWRTPLLPLISLISLPPVLSVLAQDLHAQPAPRFESEPRVTLRLLDGAHQRAARGDHELARPHDAGALPLEELAVDGDAAGAGDLAAGEHALGADDELRALPQRDGALLEEALDLHAGAAVELQRRVAEHVSLAEVALDAGGRRHLA